MERKFECHRQLIGGVLSPRTDAIQKDYDSFVSTAKDGCYVETLQLAKKPKSEQQVRAIFGLAIKTIVTTFDDNGWDTSYLLKLDIPTGNPVTKGLMKEYLYSVCAIQDEEGNLVTISKMNTVQAAQFFDAIRNFAVTQWGIYIPEPNPNWRTL